MLRSIQGWIRLFGSPGTKATRLPRAALRVEKLEDRLALSGVQIVDNGDSGFNTTGNWSRSRAGFSDDILLSSAGTGADVAQWNFTNLEPGEYRVSATWVAKKNRASNAPFTISDGSASLATMQVNQRVAPNDFRDVDAVWEELGTIRLTGNSLSVRLSDRGNGQVCAGAVRIEFVPSQPTPPDIVYVSTTSEFRSAVATATPGRHILLRPGIYEGDTTLPAYKEQPIGPFELQPPMWRKCLCFVAAAQRSSFRTQPTWNCAI